MNECENKCAKRNELISEREMRMGTVDLVAY